MDTYYDFKEYKSFKEVISLTISVSVEPKIARHSDINNVVQVDAVIAAKVEVNLPRVIIDILREQIFIVHSLKRFYWGEVFFNTLKEKYPDIFYKYYLAPLNFPRCHLDGYTLDLDFARLRSSSIRIGNYFRL